MRCNETRHAHADSQSHDFGGAQLGGAPSWKWACVLRGGFVWLAYGVVHGVGRLPGYPEDTAHCQVCAVPCDCVAG